MPVRIRKPLEDFSGRLRIAGQGFVITTHTTDDPTYISRALNENGHMIESAAMTMPHHACADLLSLLSRYTLGDYTTK